MSATSVLSIRSGITVLGGQTAQLVEVMKRAYKYKGFVIAVDLEPVWEASGNVTLLPPRGFIAIVNIMMAGMDRPMVAPLRLAADKQQPFAKEADALMAGFSAGQRVVDDMLIP